MFALRKAQPGIGLERADLPEPVPDIRDVVIRVTRAGICGTDRHIYDWDAWASSRIPLGTTIGHEFVGTVHSVGDAVRRVKVGDRVSAEGHVGCGICEPCRTGNGHICERVDILGIDIDGCFADFVRVPERNVWPVTDAIDDRMAAMFDPFGNAVHTVMEAGVAGRSVLVTGCGVIGLMAIAVARASGAGRIFATDVSAERLALAAGLGADHVFAADDPEWVSICRGLTHGQGPQVLLEMSGNPEAIRDGFRALRNGGTVAMLGLPVEPIAFDLPNDVIFKGVTVLGINGRRIFQTWYQMEELLLSGRIAIDSLITHEFPISEYESGFAALQSGEAIKVQLVVA